MNGQVLVSVKDLTVEYGRGVSRFTAVSGVSFEIRQGETLGLVGESGCGKSTTGRTLLQLQAAAGGSVRFREMELTKLSFREMLPLRPALQIVFKDPISSLNPRRRIGDIVAEPLVIAGIADRRERERRVREALTAVGIDADAAMERRPHQFSGGQCQRICIARALVNEPEFLVCDEPVSSLDVSVQAQILNLLEDMKDRYRLTMLFVSHDLAVVKNISDRVAVMYLGQICEIAPSARLYEAPAHPYTAALLASIPEIDRTGNGGSKPKTLKGEIPSPQNPPGGCRFHTRCPIAREKCALETPVFQDLKDGHSVACHFPLAVPASVRPAPAIAGQV